MTQPEYPTMKHASSKFITGFSISHPSTWTESKGWLRIWGKSHMNDRHQNNKHVYKIWTKETGEKQTIQLRYMI